MKLDYSVGSIDAEFVFDRNLEADLVLVQELFVRSARKWSSDLRIVKGGRVQCSIDCSVPSALQDAVLADQGWRNFELRGAGRELTVILSTDHRIVRRIGRAMHLNNKISLQVRRKNVEGISSDDWSRRAFELFAAALSPAWATARHPDEYWAKTMSDDPNRIEAIGRDFGQWLPGLYWLNYFGEPYRGLLGDERLLSTPSHDTRMLGSGVLVVLGQDPTEWNGPGFAAAEQAVRDHLGTELFFSKAHPALPEGLVPAWEGDRLA